MVVMRTAGDPLVNVIQLMTAAEQRLIIMAACYTRCVCVFLDLLHTEDQNPPTSKYCLRHGLRLGTFTKSHPRTASWLR